MRNLRLVHSVRVGDASELSSATHLSVDYDTGWVYCATAGGVVVLDPSTQEVISQVDLVSASYLTRDVSIVGMQHLPDQMSVAIATSKGDMLLWNPATFEVECAGSVESGITAMGWSPDHELVVIATGQATLIMMTREFDPVMEVPMEPAEFGEAENISVGWGKKETQFHGSEGKQAAQRKLETVKPCFSWDDRAVRISWRGDGQMFSVSTIDSANDARRVRVWTRECVLHSSSEIVDGLEQALAWRPSGTLIASSQRRPNKHDIVFFEQNGLRHGEFTLPYGVKEVKVRELLWNQDSSVLVTWCEDFLQGDDGDKASQSYVDLWTVNNYHWYHKQHLRFSSQDCVSALCWDPEQAYRLHVLSASGQYIQYTWAWAMDVSRGQTQEDLALVAVIDGDKLLLTPFRQMLVPPPMCAYYLQLPEPVNQVVFAPLPNSNRLAVVLASGRIMVYHHCDQVEGAADESVKVAAAGGNGFVVRCGLPQRQASYSITHDATVEYPCQRYHVTWLPGDVFAYSTLNPMGSQSTLGLLRILDDTLQASTVAELDGYQYGCAVHPGTGHMILQLTDGSLYTYSPEQNEVLPYTKHGRQMKFPLPCTQMALDVMDREDVALGLTERFRFYVNEQEVANNVTSFCLHSEFLLLTTHSHTCRCIHRNTPLKDLPSLSSERTHPFDETIRRVERGSRIVCSVPMDTKLILQMPRGNLETIHPRALVLSSVHCMLEDRDYAQAFITLRKHRLNMNLLCDHNLKVFLDNVEAFIDQVDSVTSINLFLTDLQAEDVTRTMYTGAYTNKPPAAVTHKVDTICDAMCTALENKDADKYLLAILTSYVRKTTPQLEVALNRIKKLRDSGPQSCHVSAEEALKYLLFLVDVNELYDVALGTYDFELVVMVAQKSQKDPKEYLPFLNELRKMEVNYQRYSIDRHLKRHVKALEHISRCGAEHFPECLSLVNEQRLYARALQLYTKGSSEYQALAEAYAAYLSDKRHHQEAGLILLRAGLLEGALKAYESSQDWRQALCVCSMLGMSEDKLQELARRMAESLKNSRRHLEASCLLEQYGQDVEEAIVTLIEGSEWLEALRLMHRYKRVDFIETNLKPSVMEASENMMESLEAARLDYERYTKRLAVVRELKEQARLELMEGGGGAADSDLFSDTSSATGESVVSATSKASSRFTTDTQRSNMSGRSGKSRRKAERRKWSLKEGSRNEDLALIETLHQAAGQAEEKKKEVSSLLCILVQLNYEDHAMRLQRALDALLMTVTRAIPEIWDPEQEDLAGGVLIAPLGPGSTANSIAQAMQAGRGGTRQEVQLDAHLRVPPTLSSDIRWQLHMLRPNET